MRPPPTETALAFPVSADRVFGALIPFQQTMSPFDRSAHALLGSPCPEMFATPDETEVAGYVIAPAGGLESPPMPSLPATPPEPPPEGFPPEPLPLPPVAGSASEPLPFGGEPQSKEQVAFVSLASQVPFPQPEGQFVRHWIVSFD